MDTNCKTVTQDSKTMIADKKGCDKGKIWVLEVLCKCSKNIQYEFTIPAFGACRVAERETAGKIDTCEKQKANSTAATTPNPAIKTTPVKSTGSPKTTTPASVKTTTDPGIVFFSITKYWRFENLKNVLSIPRVNVWRFHNKNSISCFNN